MTTNASAMTAKTATQNACKLCTPLGACLAFRGIESCVPFLHGSQGCATYIRRYLISHYKEPIDIASSNFNEETAVFGGSHNLQLGLKNVTQQYKPQVIGIATTCLSETIGDDVPMILKDYKAIMNDPNLPTMIFASTPSYSGSHIDGFHTAVRSAVKTFAVGGAKKNLLNLFSGMISPADIRYLKEILKEFGMPFMLLPDYSQTLDGGPWGEYHRIPPGGTPTSAIADSGSAAASIEFGSTLEAKKSAAGYLEAEFGVPRHQLPLPIGIKATDRFFALLEELTEKPMPEKYEDERRRLVDAYADGHKYIFGRKAMLYGEEDLVISMAAFLREIGVVPVLCASGGKSGQMKQRMLELIPDMDEQGIEACEGVDFVDIEHEAERLKPDMLIGNSKGFTMSKKHELPLIRIGFPIHDRFGGQRLHHLGYRGTQELFDRIVNTVIEERQKSSPIGYTYM
ncbi:MAG TPA: nitrogenase [Chlorobaculum sp.]|uniref:Nitrogenase iron-molybdenum cofactor biosynthesis protein NifN, putative n=1 Tax=Chlorobaculum tepidum (strain ATCC 49652 / DSM 12025 / NBRC 103806 / TLS) TaxID=194439 RepID=Q8KC86_CHLTE|nr:nitrogenase component 1 [Chlorobaculum tepidum]AAM72765.1 nitrogenase iron-molybdenum cofactor biosynthesis protein NifN, putative [Chlorobaculum tepidum TLS]HBU22394.1 nitrogenase [Chlorobaculum sp.]